LELGSGLIGAVGLSSPEVSIDDLSAGLIDASAELPLVLLLLVVVLVSVLPLSLGDLPSTSWYQKRSVDK
tara:strand:- start:118 stop:327 length:210 start_codon:yes stop_codon:yes gene_type:complete